MKDILCLLMTLLLSLSAICQDTILNSSISFENPKFKSDNLIQIADRDNQKLSLIFQDDELVETFLYNHEMDNIVTYSGKSLPRKYGITLGTNVGSKGRNLVFMGNKALDKFGVLILEHESKSTQAKELAIELKDEKFLQSFTHNKVFYLLTIQKRSSILNLYVFDNEANYEVRNFDFSDVRLRHWDRKVRDLYMLVTKPKGADVDKILVKIDEETPNSLEAATALSKLYIFENSLLLTSDSNTDFTQILKIDLKNWEKDFTVLNKPFMMGDIQDKKSNSFVLGDKFLAFSKSRTQLKVEITSMSDRKLLWSDEVQNDSPIAFKNTPIVIEGLYSNNNKEIENTKRFFQKLSSSSVGICGFDGGDFNEVTIGAVQYVDTGKAISQTIMSMIPLPVVSVNDYFNITAYAYYSYINSKASYIKIKFDQKFERVEGDLHPNVFDRIKEFKEGQDIENEIVFRFNDKTAMGYLEDGNRILLITF